MKCEVCERRLATEVFQSHGFDFNVCAECLPGVKSTNALIATVEDFGIPVQSAADIVNAAMDEAIRKLRV